jgi:hypothetical protein
MRRQAAFSALLMVGVGVILGATVFRSDIAQATGLAQAVTVSNTAAQAVPVREQGTPDVKLTSVAPVTDGGGATDFGGATGGTYTPSSAQVASAVWIKMTGPVSAVLFTYQGNTVATFLGPYEDGGDNVALSFTRPIEFDHILCGDILGLPVDCAVSWVGG